MAYSEPFLLLSLPMMPQQYGPDPGCPSSEQPVTGVALGPAVGVLVAVGTVVVVLVAVGPVVGVLADVGTIVVVLVAVGPAVAVGSGVPVGVGVDLEWPC